HADETIGGGRDGSCLARGIYGCFATCAPLSGCADPDGIVCLQQRIRQLGFDVDRNVEPFTRSLCREKLGQARSSCKSCLSELIRYDQNRIERVGGSPLYERAGIPA